MMQAETEMYQHCDIEDNVLYREIRNGSIQFAGNFKLKIFGTLSCTSGKRMKKNNRVFFKSRMEAISMGFRPCGHCLLREYQQWVKKE
jgi:methylphosphotriester-DNA--protein-cysteine methyltransferase